MTAHSLGISPALRFRRSLLSTSSHFQTPKRANQLVPSQELGPWPMSLPSTAPRPRTATAGYRYHGAEGPEPQAAQLVQLKASLEQHRLLLAVKSAEIRAVNSRLTICLAQALVEGLRVGTLAEIAQLSRTEVRRAGRTFDDLHPTGVSRHGQLAEIRSKGEELATLKQSKASVEARLVELISTARRQRTLDDFELAQLTGFRHDHIRRLTWGKGANDSPTRSRRV